MSGTALIRVLLVLGYVQVRSKGSHIRLSCPGRRSITVPKHKEIGPALFRKILRDAEIRGEEYKRLFPEK
jgi:predicted RNA binding protein YcfA (HicA-like mRNA interferase family)